MSSLGIGLYSTDDLLDELSSRAPNIEEVNRLVRLLTRKWLARRPEDRMAMPEPAPANEEDGA